MPPILIFDFETTGLTPGYHDPIQVAAVLATPDLEEIGAFESLIRPRNPQNASERAMEIHGKSMAELMEAPDAWSVFQAFAEFAYSRGVPYLAGFNVDFDLRFLAASEEALGFRLDKRSPAIDARRIYLTAKRLSPFTKGTTLTCLCEEYGINTEGAHDALSDVRMTLQLLKRLKADHPAAFGFLYQEAQ